MRHKKCYLIVAVAILIFSGLASAQVEINPSTMELDLIGGDIVTEQITITWTGETAVVGFIGATVIATATNGDGIDVTYSENPVILHPNLPKVLDMTISVAINITPDTYSITTDAFTEIEQIIKYKTVHKTIYRTVDVINLTRVTELLVIIQQLQEKINQTTNHTDLLPLITMLQDAFDEWTTAIKDEGSEPEEKKDDFPLFFAFLIIVIVAIIFFIVMVYLYHKVRVLELQRIKEMKENEKNK